MRCTSWACCTTKRETTRRAVEMISRAVAIRPNVAAFHANLAEAYRALGQLDRPSAVARRLSAWLRIIPKP